MNNVTPLPTTPIGHGAGELYNYGAQCEFVEDGCISDYYILTNDTHFVIAAVRELGELAHHPQSPSQGLIHSHPGPFGGNFVYLSYWMFQVFGPTHPLSFNLRPHSKNPGLAPASV